MRLKDELVKERERDALAERKIEEDDIGKDQELIALRDALVDQVNMKSEILDLKEQLAVVKHELNCFKQAEANGTFGEIETSKLYIDSQKRNEKLQSDVDRLETNLSQARHDHKQLQEVHEKYLDQTRQMKREKILLERMFSCDRKHNPEALVDKLMSSDPKEAEAVMSELQTTTDYSDVERNLSPRPMPYTGVDDDEDGFDLNCDADLF